MGFESIKNQISSLNRTFDIDMIERAYRFAEECHNDQVRYTGESFIEHPTSVAMILLEMGLDSETIAAALLHDVVEDTDITLGDIEKNFGKEITNLVDGATKLGRVPYSSQEEEQAENIRKLLLAMSEDIRVMLIKLCDRLHNMRTASGWDEQTQRDKSLETMEVFAPIAHRLGMNNIKEELEDLSLKYLDPFGYSEIEKILNEKHNSEDFIEGITECILVRLNEIGLINPLIEYRIKSRYGIYRKLYIQNRSLEEIYDIYALRIILENSNDCYNALGIVHDMYRSIPNRFKDYISTPKPNGYKSLQSTVVDAKGVAFEVQIRTREMHYEAEYGIAAHWKYKLGIKTDDSLEKRLAWVRQLLEAQRDAEDATDILSNIKSDLLPEEVYVFTPKGDVINLPAGSCVIDFAYAIHTAVGNRMMGAKVGGRIVPITYKVKTGEFIEILTGPADKGPSRDWLNIVHTSGAKSKIRAWFKRERREENIIEGKTYFERELRRHLINIPSNMASDFAQAVAKRQKFASADDMYAALGYGGILMSRVIPKVRDEYKRMISPDEDPAKLFDIPLTRPKKIPDEVIVEGIDNCLVRFANCCNPLPGDDIIGFITRGQGVTVHKTDCTNVTTGRYLDENSLRWINVHWSDTIKDNYRATLDIIALNRDALLADLTAALSNMHIPIFAMNAKITTDKRAMVVTTIGVNNTEHLKSIISKLQKIRDVQVVERFSK